MCWSRGIVPPIALREQITIECPERIGPGRATPSAPAKLQSAAVDKDAQLQRFRVHS